MSEKIVIIGASGLTGLKLAKLASSKYSVYGTYKNRKFSLDSVEPVQLDITDKDGVTRFFDRLNPDVIVNASALHNVDYCETHQDEALSVNVYAVQALAHLAEKAGAKFVHISTDYVFDGKNNSKYKEIDPASPVNFYGKTKLMSEEMLKRFPNCLILRSSVIYGWTPLELFGLNSSSGKPVNFALWVLNMLAKGEVLRIVTDQFSSPTLADNLAEVIMEMIDRDISGLFHVSGLTCIDRYEFTKTLIKTFGYTEDQLIPVLSKDFKQVAPRPMKTCLDCSKAQSLGLRLLTLEESLDRMHRDVEVHCPGLIGPRSRS